MRVAPGGRALLDAHGEPVFFVGDSPWFIVNQLTFAEATMYFKDRHTRGFDAVLFEMMLGPRENPSVVNREGQGPFTTPGDFATPNDAYFAHVENLVTLAHDRGMLVFLAPCWLNEGEGWYTELVANGGAKSRTFGQYVGRRFARFDNIVYVDGGDVDVAPGNEAALANREILLGIRDVDPGKLHTFHGGRFSYSMRYPDFAPYMGLDAVYSGNVTWNDSLAAYAASTLPQFLIESRYEGLESWTGDFNAPPLVRGSLYSNALSGSAGVIFGSNDIYPFDSRWRTGLAGERSREAPLVGRFMRGLPFASLVPDVAHRVVVAGAGSTTSADFVVAARASDGSAIAAYVSSSTATRAFTVDMSQLAGAADAQWFDPTNGVWRPDVSGVVPNTGTHLFMVPGANATGAFDWLLVLRRTTTPTMDAGVARVDAGVPRPDAGVLRADAGSSRSDADVPRVDAGLPRADAGVPRVDAGSGHVDAARPDAASTPEGGRPDASSHRDVGGTGPSDAASVLPPDTLHGSCACSIGVGIRRDRDALVLFGLALALACRRRRRGPRIVRATSPTPGMTRLYA